MAGVEPAIGHGHNVPPHRLDSCSALRKGFEPLLRRSERRVLPLHYPRMRLRPMIVAVVLLNGKFPFGWPPRGEVVGPHRVPDREARSQPQFALGDRWLDP